MTAALVLQLLGGAGFLAGVAALLHFLNTRKSTRTKGSAEAYQAYREFVHGAFADVDTQFDRVVEERTKLQVTVRLLLNLAQTLIDMLRQEGVPPSQILTLQERLDDIRRR